MKGELPELSLRGDIKLFMEHLVLLYEEGKHLDWEDYPLTRINALMLCQLITNKINQ